MERSSWKISKCQIQNRGLVGGWGEGNSASWAHEQVLAPEVLNPDYWIKKLSQTFRWGGHTKDSSLVGPSDCPLVNPKQETHTTSPVGSVPTRFFLSLLDPGLVHTGGAAGGEASGDCFGGCLGAAIRVSTLLIPHGFDVTATPHPAARDLPILAPGGVTPPVILWHLEEQGPLVSQTTTQKIGKARPSFQSSHCHQEMLYAPTQAGHSQ